MPRQTLTQHFVERCRPPARGRVDYFDTRMPGLVCRVLASGTRTYSLRYRTLRGRQVERKLASARVLRLAEARRLSRYLLAKVAMGEDPFAEQRARQAVPTLAAFVKTAYLPHVQGYKRSWKTDETLLRLHILPALGRLYLDEIGRGDIVRLLGRHRAGHMPASTNRVLVLCRYIFNCALKWEEPGLERNPTSGIALYPENNRRERYLKQDEARRLFAELESSPNRQLPRIVAMLLLTGARKREVLDARWQDMDLDKRQWRIVFTKAGRPRHVPLSRGAMRLLASLPRGAGSVYLFPNPKTGRPYVSVFHSWNTARRRAGLADVRMHDLRHSFASYVVNAGRSLYEVQTLLGHAHMSTTQRYAHLSQESLLQAADSAAEAVPWHGGELKGDLLP